jgi:hypothetical protein
MWKTANCFIYLHVTEWGRKNEKRRSKGSDLEDSLSLGYGTHVGLYIGIGISEELAAAILKVVILVRMT